MIQASDRKQFVKELLADVQKLVERGQDEHINKVEINDDNCYSSRNFSLDVPEIGWVNVTYTERKRL